LRLGHLPNCDGRGGLGELHELRHRSLPKRRWRRGLRGLPRGYQTAHDRCNLVAGLPVLRRGHVLRRGRDLVHELRHRHLHVRDGRHLLHELHRGPVRDRDGRGGLDDVWKLRGGLLRERGVVLELRHVPARLVSNVRGRNHVHQLPCRHHLDRGGRLARVDMSELRRGPVLVLWGDGLHGMRCRDVSS
jgi:hypothetical protein